MVPHRHGMAHAMAQVGQDEEALARYSATLIGSHDARALAVTMKNVESQRGTSKAPYTA